MVCTFGLSERTLLFVQSIFEQPMAGAFVLAGDDVADVAIIDLDVDGGRAEFERQQEQYPGRRIVLLTTDEASAKALLNGVVIAKPVDVNHFFKVMKAIAKWMSKEQGEGTSGPTESNVPPTHGAVVTASQASPTEQAAMEAVGAARKVGLLAPDAERAWATLHPRARHYFLGTQADVNLDVPEERAKVYYDPAEFLQGFVHRAIRTGVETASVMIVSGSRFGSIEIYPFARLARASANSAALYAVARLPLGEGDVSIEPAPELPQMPLNHEGAEPLDALLWQLALWASRGHAPMGTNLDEPVVLKHWPNVSRLLFPPHAAQIVALWARRATTLANTASTLVIPQRYVFACYSACVALDLIRADRRSVPRPVAPQSPVAPEKQTLFGMLRAKLAQGRDD